MIVLGIEGTAHTISAGIIDEENIYYTSSRTYHPKDGGIHPREAANHHFENILPVIREALKQSSMNIGDIDLIGFSRGPGLGPCLKIVAVAARSLSIRNNIPLLGVNHPMGHIEIGKRTTGSKDPLVLYVSGGNTQIITGGKGKYRVVGETLDIGIGNMLDKFARDIGIPFPGGPAIEQYALRGKELLALPYSVKGMDTAFSGIYTAAKHLKEKGHNVEDICYSIQEVAFSMLCETLERAIYTTGKREILLTGGVARNGRLREMISILAKEANCKVFETPVEYCMDNGSMIAQAALMMYQNGIRHNLEDTSVDQKFRIDQAPAPWISSGMSEVIEDQGAESVISHNEFLGINAVIKKRLSKSYRDKRLDGMILNERTGREMRILAKGIESGVNFPILLDYNSEGTEIVLEKIEGSLLNAVLEKGENLTHNIFSLGKEVAKMHNSNISHGDLNLNNIIVSGENIFIIDPSLGSLSPGVEEFATDIKMVNDFLAGYEDRGKDLSDIFLESYKSNFQRWDEVMSVLKEMEVRKRYS